MTAAPTTPSLFRPPDAVGRVALHPSLRSGQKLSFQSYYLINKHTPTKCGGVFVGRGDRIRTCGLCVPNAALYQTEPHLVILLNFAIYKTYALLCLRAATQLNSCGARNLKRPSGNKFRPLRLFALPFSSTGRGRPQSYQTEPHLVILLNFVVYKSIISFWLRAAS